MRPYQSLLDLPPGRAPRRRTWPSPSLLLFVLPSAILLLIVLLPLAGTIFAAAPGDLARALGDAEVARSLWVTFTAGVAATIAGLLTGVPLAYLLARRRFPGRRLVQGIIALPVVIPHTAAGVALLLAFGRRGILGQFMVPLGIEFTDTFSGVALAMLFVGAPFLVSMSQEAFALVDGELERVALTDGATRWQAFWLVAVPAAWRGIVSGALMMWARGVSEFGAVAIIAYHPKIVPVLVYELFTGYGLRAALPVAVLLILIVLPAFVLLRLLLAGDGDGA